MREAVMAKVKVFIGMLLALVAGCSESASDKNQQPATQGVIDVSSLPACVSEGDGFPLPAPELCVWAMSMDALVWGRLLDVQLSDSPAVDQRTDGWTWAAGCPVGSSPALKLEVDITRSLRGSLAGRVVAVMGALQVSMLVPEPSRGSGNDVKWLTPNNGGGRGPLLPGRPIGLALQYVPTPGVWSVMGEAMFGLGLDGRVVFQERTGPVFEPAPKGAAGMMPGEFDAAVATCSSAHAAAAAQRRAWVWRTWGPTGQVPSAYAAAVCHQSP
jgi:hypothetical protein